MVSSLHYLTTQKESVAKSGVWDESEGRKVFRDKEGVMTVLRISDFDFQRATCRLHGIESIDSTLL